MDFEIRPMTLKDCEKVALFGDQWIGINYLDLDLVKSMLTGNEDYCFVAVDKKSQEKLLAIRITLGPQSWPKFIKKGMDETKWPVSKEKLAYFKSLFVAAPWQKMGLGKALSAQSLQALRKDGVEGVVCHSWLESPQNSSKIYLEKMGFSELNRYPRFWYDQDYECIRCGAGNSCVCTASEMFKKLN